MDAMREDSDSSGLSEMSDYSQGRSKRQRTSESQPDDTLLPRYYAIGIVDGGLISTSRSVRTVKIDTNVLLAASNNQGIAQSLYDQITGNVVIQLESIDLTGLFADKWQGILSNIVPHDEASIQVEIPLFKDDRFATMDRWTEDKSMVHGHVEQAEAHVKAWMDVACRLPPSTTYDIVMYHPWRNYRYLGALTATLRDHTKEPASQVRVVVDSLDTWSAIPLKGRHLTWTVAAIFGIKVPAHRDIGHADACQLVDHGCRGFRGIPDKIPS